MFGLLPAPLEKTVRELQPKGKVNIGATLNKADSNDYTITVDCLNNSVNFERFAYPLKDITGRLTITKDTVKLQNITATAADNVQITPDTSTIKLNGEIALADNGLSGGRFTLCANDIFFDERLGAALPEGVRAYYDELSPTGRFDVNDINVEILNAADGEKYIGFTGAVKFKTCSVNVSVPITELDAELEEIKGL